MDNSEINPQYHLVVLLIKSLELLIFYSINCRARIEVFISDHSINKKKKEVGSIATLSKHKMVHRTELIGFNPCFVQFNVMDLQMIKPVDAIKKRKQEKKKRKRREKKKSSGG